MNPCHCCDSCDANCLACNRAKYIQALVNYSKTVQMPYSCSPCCAPPAPCRPSCAPCQPICGSPPCCPQPCCPGPVCPCPDPCCAPAPAPCPPPEKPSCPPCESWWRKLIRAIFRFIADLLCLLHIILCFILRRIENLYNFYYAFLAAHIFLKIAFVISFTAFLISLIINYKANSPRICPPPRIIERCPNK